MMLFSTKFLTSYILTTTYLTSAQSYTYTPSIAGLIDNFDDDGNPVPSNRTSGNRALEDTQSMLVSLACHGVTNCQVRMRWYWNALRNYGCNCYPENYDRENIITGDEQMHFGGNGQPVDELDGACLKAFMNYRCYKYDLEQSNFKKYNVVFGPHEKCHIGVSFEYHMGRNGGLICGPESNPNYRFDRSANICKLYACNVEREFAETAYRILGDQPGKFRDENLNAYGLGKNNLCEKKNNVMTKRTSCCGNYPNRLPYDPNRHQCCSGEVKSFGDC